MKAAADFASIGILIYTASFAALETGVMLVVMAWKVKEYFDEKSAERTKRITADVEARALARWREAERLSHETGERIEDIYLRLRDEGWFDAFYNGA